MKRKNLQYAVLGGAITAVLIAVTAWSWPQPQEEGVSPPTPDAADAKVVPPRQPAAPSPAAAKASPSYVRNVREPGGFASFPLQTPNYDVSFYGRVVDQDNRPVPGVVVVLNVDERLFRLTTDAKGQFGLEGASGKCLHITNLQKAGYLQMPEGRSGGMYDYASYLPNRHRPDPANPVTLHIWKASGHPEPLLSFESGGDLSLDGRTYSFDLLHHRKEISATAAGDLRITARETQDSSIPEERRWELTIAAVDGGLKSEKVFGWMAPEEGYDPEFRFTGQRPPKPDAWLFFRSRNGHVCGRFTVNAFLWDSATLRVIIRGVLSPTGSRNLERDGNNVVGEYEALSNFKPWRVPSAGTPPSRPALKTQPPGVFKAPPPEKPKETQMAAFPTGDLYCRFVDQDDKPAAGIDVQAEIPGLPPTPEEIERSGFVRGPQLEKLKAVRSDNNGMIVLPKVRFGHVGTKILRDDYLPDPTAKPSLEFGTDPAQGRLGMSADRTFVRRVWKRQGPLQPLICREITVPCGSDGTPMPVDLLKWPPPLDKKTAPESADWKFIITIDQVKNEMPTLAKRPNWHFTIQAINGGILETKDKFSYSVPELGYKPELRWTQNGKADQGDMCVFFEARGGKVHGRATFSISLDDTYNFLSEKKAAHVIPPRYEILVTYTLNPTGSRSLEPDPKRSYETYDEYLKAQSPTK